MDMKLGSLVSLVALVASACGLSTSLEGLPGPGEVDVPIGEEVALPGTVVRLAFTAVTGDSRCPLGVVCVWEGDAAVSIALTAGTGPTQPFEIHSALDPRFVDFAGVRVTLVGLSPYPRDGEPIDPDDYVARFGTEPQAP